MRDPRQELAAVLGRDAVSATRSVTIDGLRSSAVAEPPDREALVEALRACGSEKFAVAPVGNGSALALGNAIERFDVALRTTRLSRILEYDPRDLVATVEPGVRVVDLLAKLQENGQTLPLDPAGVEDRTVGGLVATNAFGPKRARYGPPRDYVIGAALATPDGKVTRAGGRVVKNVSGFDIHKLLCGSLGSFGVLVEISLKLKPLERSRRTVLLEARDAEAASEFFVKLGRGRFLPSAADAWIEEEPRLRVAVLFEESVEAVAAQIEAVKALGLEPSAVLDDDSDVWRALREVARPADDAVVVRIACRPTAAIPLLVALRAKAGPGARAVARPAAGAVIVRFDAGRGDGARARIEDIRAGLPEGSFAVVESAPADVKRSGVETLAIPGPALEVHRRLKRVFDPERVLSPGRIGRGV